MTLFAIGLKYDAQMNIWVRTVYEIVSCSKFGTSTFAPNQRFIRLFATATYLTTETVVQLLI